MALIDVGLLTLEGALEEMQKIKTGTVVECLLCKEYGVCSLCEISQDVCKSFKKSCEDKKITYNVKRFIIASLKRAIKTKIRMMKVK